MELIECYRSYLELTRQIAVSIAAGTYDRVLDLIRERQRVLSRLEALDVEECILDAESPREVADTLLALSREAIQCNIENLEDLKEHRKGILAAGARGGDPPIRRGKGGTYFRIYDGWGRGEPG